MNKTTEGGTAGVNGLVKGNMRGLGKKGRKGGGGSEGCAKKGDSKGEGWEG